MLCRLQAPKLRHIRPERSCNFSLDLAVNHVIPKLPEHIRTWTLIAFGFGDSDLVISTLSGKGACAAANLKAVADRTLHLMQLLSREGLKQTTAEGNYFKRTPRTYNSEADSLANQALDLQQAFVNADSEAWASVVTMQSVNFEIGFDGAARSNPGPAADRSG